MTELWTEDPRTALRVTQDFDLASFDRGGTPAFGGSKGEARQLMAERGELMAELQERLYANGRAGDTRSVLVVVQGLDTAGKGGIARHVMGMVDPQGVALRSFGVPTPEEQRHHYLWRIKRALPKPGLIGLFDRSHYEDVLVVRVNELVAPEVWQKRYAEINRWEKSLVESGTIVLKFALMVSYEEQALRLMERIDRPDKRWKYSLSDMDTRVKWDPFQDAYADVFRLTSTEHAPWYVLPADRKWYPRAAVTEVLTRTLIDMNLQWPKPRWRPDAQRRRLAKTMAPQTFAESTADTQAIVETAISESLDVKVEAAAVRTAHNTAEREAAYAAITAKRDEWEADLAATLEQKRALLAELAPELAPSPEPAPEAKPSKKGKPAKKGESAKKGKAPKKARPEKKPKKKAKTS